jgi:NTE family protein
VRRPAVPDPLDPFVIKQSLDRLLGWPLGPDGVRAYLNALVACRRVWAPLPWERRSPAPEPFGVLPPHEDVPGQPLAGRKVGLVVSGGSGNLAATCGVVRAIEEAGGTIAAVSGCSGGSLWAAQAAMGWSADRMVRFSLGELDPRDYLDLQPVRSTLRSLWTGEAFTGVIKGDRVQALFEEVGLGVRVGDLPIPFYSILWEVESNSILYAGTRTTPDWTLGEAVRGSLSLAPVVDPMPRDGRHYVDGGVVNVFPVRPLLEHHPEIELFVGVNAFLPRGFVGPDLSGWKQGRLGVLQAARQLQLAPFQELARREWDSISDRAWLIQPVTDEQAYGVNFFAAMIDRSVWPERMRAGHAEARRVLAG